MKYVREFRDGDVGRRLVDRIYKKSRKPVRFMEFCGGHTTSIARYGIRQMLPPTIEMLSGPGCPVCVTAHADLDKAIALSQLPDLIITTFGDMLKVPASHSSLQRVRAEGGDVRVVYSALDALHIAKANPSKSIVFIGIGFETTAPTVAASILQAEQEGISNYYVLSQHKVCPPVIKALLDAKEIRLDGIICPGHVSAVIGSRPYDFIPRNYGIGCVVAGFEPVDVLQCIEMLVKQVENGEPKVEIAYRRGVRPEGNSTALEIMYKVFKIDDAEWRGIGTIPESGLFVRKGYQRYDAERVFDFSVGESLEPKGCICGDILRGVKTPQDCTLFRIVCTPEHPIGPCMVSSEGSCSAYYLYSER